jgi:transcriptional antiterminator
MAIKDRKRRILQDLITSNLPITLEDFANRYQRKERMIRYDLDFIKEELNNYGVILHHKNKVGYFILAEDKHKIPSEAGVATSKQLSKTEMEIEIYFCLLLSDQHVSADHLAEALFSSPSSIGRLLQDYSVIENSDVSVEVKRFQGYLLNGSSEDKLTLASKILTKELSNYVIVDDFYSMLPTKLKQKVTYEFCQKLDVALKIQNRNSDIWLTQKSYFEFYMFCLVILAFDERKLDPLQKQASTKEEYEYVREVLDAVQRRSDVLLDYLITQMRQCGIIVNKENRRDDLRRIINLMTTAIDHPEYYDVHKFAFDLFPHLNQSIQRWESNHPEMDNPLRHQLFTKYPDEKIIAEKMYSILMQELDIPYSSNEISYLIMYLYKHRKSNEYNKVRVAVVCATGRGFSNLMEARLINRFTNLSIIKTISAFHHETFSSDEIDLIISTIPIKTKEIPTVIVSPILGYEDIEKIRKIIDFGEYSTVLPYEKEFAGSTLITDSKADLPMYANLISRITVYLLDTLAEIMREYSLSHDKMLGVTIHMLMAIERWYKSESEQFEDAVSIYQKIAEDHPKLYNQMEEFFTSVEQALQCSINYSERISFFHYIL